MSQYECTRTPGDRMLRATLLPETMHPIETRDPVMTVENSAWDPEPAADVACQAQVAAMLATRHGAHEFEVEAALQYVYRMNDCVAAYEPIVGAGAPGRPARRSAGSAGRRGWCLILC